MANTLLSVGGPVRVLVDRADKSDLPRALAGFLARHRGPFTFAFETERVDLGPVKVVERRDVFARLEALRAERGWSAEEVLCLLTPRPDSLNWYSAFSEKGPAAFYIHSRGWEGYGTVRRDAAVAYDIFQNLLYLGLAAAGVRYEDCLHVQSVGCISDFCESKEEWLLKLRTADVCGECLDRFEKHGASPEVLCQAIGVLEAARDTALSTSRFRPGVAVFAEWPFPVAITRHKAAHETRAARRAFALLDHFDSLVRYAVLATVARAGIDPRLEPRPSLGHWVSHLQRLVEEPLRGDVLRVINGSQLVKYRNEARAHGWLRPEREFEADLPDLLSAIGALESLLDPFLRQNVPVIVQGVELSEAGSFLVRGARLAGSNPLFEPWQMEVDADPRTLGAKVGAISLTDSSRLYSMDPWLRWATCAECEHERVLIADGEVFIDAQVGHRSSQLHVPRPTPAQRLTPTAPRNPRAGA